MLETMNEYGSKSSKVAGDTITDMREGMAMVPTLNEPEVQIQVYEETTGSKLSNR